MGGGGGGRILESDGKFLRRRGGVIVTEDFWKEWKFLSEKLWFLDFLTIRLVIFVFNGIEVGMKGVMRGGGRRIVESLAENF